MPVLENLKMLEALGLLMDSPSLLTEFVRDPILLQSDPELKSLLMQVMALLNRGRVIEITLALPGLLQTMEKRYPVFLNRVAERVIELNTKRKGAVARPPSPVFNAIPFPQRKEIPR